MKRWLWIGALILTFGGILITTILTWGHFNGIIGQICGANSGCNTVLSSEYSRFLGIPTALYGLLFYLTALLCFLFYPLVTKENKTIVLNFLLGIISFTFLFSAGLTLYSINALQTTCNYCLGSMTIVTLLFVGIVFWRVRGQRTGEIKTTGNQLWQGIAIASLLFFLVAGGLYGQTLLTQNPTTDSNSENELQILAADAHSIGNPSAPIRVIEFYDMACPHCQRFTQNVFPDLKEEYIDTGKVLWTFRPFPITTSHPNALYAHSALELVPTHLYLDAKKRIMRNASQWSSRSNKDPEKYFSFFLKQYGISNYDPPDQSIRNRIMRKRESYMNIGINRTPSFMVNGTIYDGGMGYQRWAGIFQSILNRN